MTRNLCLVSVGVAVILLSAVHAQVPAPAPAQPPTPGSVEDVRTFADALESCKTGKVATAHPLMKSFVIEHTVTGDKDAACGYVQTMPGKMTMECKFSASGRKLMAAELRASVAGGPMRGGTSMAQPEWAKECEIVTASGARSPMVKR
jgi:hypothetical protein